MYGGGRNDKGESVLTDLFFKMSNKKPKRGGNHAKARDPDLHSLILEVVLLHTHPHPHTHTTWQALLHTRATKHRITQKQCSPVAPSPHSCAPLV
jgi:hypothetical protein